jgi:hypothetical protein
MEQASLEKLARFQAAIPYLSENEIAARWAGFSDGEKVAFTAVLQAAKPVLSRIGGAMASGAKAMGSAMGGMFGRGAAQAATTAAKPGLLSRGIDAIGTGMTVAGAGSAAWGAMNPSQPKTASLTKRALAMGLHDALDLGAYGLLAAGPVAEIAKPEWAEHNHRQLAAADVLGLGILARHHIPGLKPAGH